MREATFNRHSPYGISILSNKCFLVLCRRGGFVFIALFLAGLITRIFLAMTDCSFFPQKITSNIFSQLLFDII